MENVQCKISEQGITVILLKVMPGNEMKVVNELRTLGGEFYLGMGRHDLVVIKEAGEFEPLTEYMKHHDVIDWGSLHVFKYTPKSDQKQSFIKDKILGICCLKFEYRMLRSEGISKELELVSQLYSILGQQPSLNVIIGGSIGFYDVVIFLETSSFDALDKAVRDICEVAEKFGIVKDIITIPCVSNSRLLNTNGDYKAIEALVSEFPERINAYVMIDCVPGPEVAISNCASEIFGVKPNGIFGEHDLMIQVENEPLGSLLHRVLSFRQKSMGGIFSSLTILGFDFKERAIVEPLKQPSVEPHFSQLMARLSSFRAKSQKIYVTDLASEFIRILELFKRVEVNLTTNGIFREICPLLFQVAEAIEKLEIEEGDVYKEYCNIHETLTELIYSLFQRYSGVEGPYLFRIPSTSVEEYGGINRLIYALEALPATCIKRIDQDWKGFCLFGYAPEPRRFEFGVISMPRTVLLHPEEWHGAFHESGHEAFNLFLKSLNAEKRRELEKNLIREDLSSYEQYKFVWEFFADSYAFIYGYDGNWELYLKVFWSFLLKRGAQSKASLDMSHLLRTFAVFYAFKLDGIDKIEPKEAVEAFISSFREILMKDGGTVDWSIVRRDLLLGYEISGKGIKTISGILKKLPKPNGFQIKELSNCLKDGVAVLDSDPIQVIYSLMLDKQNNKNSFKERMAAIMTLFDYTLRNRKPVT